MTLTIVRLSRAICSQILKAKPCSFMNSIHHAGCLRQCSFRITQTTISGAGVQGTSHSVSSSTLRRTMTKPALIWQAWPIASHSPAQQRDLLDPNDVTHSKFADYPVLPGLLLLVCVGGKDSPAPAWSNALAYSSPHNVHVPPFSRLLWPADVCFYTCTRVVCELRLFISCQASRPEEPFLASNRLPHCGGATADPRQ